MRAVAQIATLGSQGGGQLNVQPGFWLTAPFNLTSHMTLFLAEGAVILGIQVKKKNYLMAFFEFWKFWMKRKIVVLNLSLFGIIHRRRESMIVCVQIELQENKRDLNKIGFFS